MAEILKVNPTRIELTNLKKRLNVAVKGHKLFKDKRDELVRVFIELVKENKRLREEVEKELQQAQSNFMLASAVMSPEVLEESVMFPTRRPQLKVGVRTIMNVDVPKLDVDIQVTEGAFPYSFAETSAELDSAVAAFSQVLVKLVKLAEVEKTCQRLADEIEKSRRRVNALEHVMIPQLQETIRYISMKLDENERSSRTRLMKVKDMLESRDAAEGE